MDVALVPEWLLLFVGLLVGREEKKKIAEFVGIGASLTFVKESLLLRRVHSRVRNHALHNVRLVGPVLIDVRDPSDGERLLIC